MAKDVKFNIKLTIDSKEQIVTASTNVKKFAEELEIARTESTKLRDDFPGANIEVWHRGTTRKSK